LFAKGKPPHILVLNHLFGGATHLGFSILWDVGAIQRFVAFLARCDLLRTPIPRFLSATRCLIGHSDWVDTGKWSNETTRISARNERQRAISARRRSPPGFQLTERTRASLDSRQRGL
jgi:hypothetical protein